MELPGFSSILKFGKMELPGFSSILKFDILSWLSDKYVKYEMCNQLLVVVAVKSGLHLSLYFM